MEWVKDQTDLDKAMKGTPEVNSTLKRKRATDYSNGEENAKRSNSKSVEHTKNLFQSGNNRSLFSPRRPRARSGDRSQSEDSNSPSHSTHQREKRQRSSDASRLRDKDRVRSQNDSDEPYPSRNSRDQSRSSEKDCDRHILDRDSRHLSHDRIPAGPRRHMSDDNTRMRFAEEAAQRRALEAKEWNKSRGYSYVKGVQGSARSEGLSSSCELDPSSRGYSISDQWQNTSSDIPKQSLRHHYTTGRVSANKEAFKDQRMDSYRELVDVLGQFGARITRQCSLQLQQDSLRKKLDQKAAEYAKSSRHFTDFPATAEAQKAAMDKVKNELSVVETELAQTQDGVHIVVQKIAEKFIPSSECTDISTSAFRELKDRVDSIHEKQETDHQVFSDSQQSWGVTKNNQKQLYDNFREFRTATQEGLDWLKDEFSDAKVKISTLTTRMDSQTPTKDLASFHTRLDNLSLQVDDLANLKMEVSRAQDGVKTLSNSFADKVADIAELKKSVYGEGDRVDQSIIHYIEVLEDNQEKFRAALKQLRDWTEDMQKDNDKTLSVMSSRIQIVESQTISTSGLENTNLSDHTAIERLQDEQKVLEETQTIVGEEVDKMLKRIDVQDKALDAERLARKTFEEAHQQFQEQIANMMNTIRQDPLTTNVEAEIDDVVKRFDKHEKSLKVAEQITKALEESHKGLRDQVANDVNNLRQEIGQTSKIVAQSMPDVYQHGAGINSQLSQNIGIVDARLNSVVQEYNNTFTMFHNKLEGVQIGQTNLDSRMNNLSTDALSRQILGQLENVYPNLRNMESSIAKFHHLTTEQSNHLNTLNSRLDSVETKLNTHATGTAVSSHQDLEDLTGKLLTVKNDLEESKHDFTKSCQAIMSNIATVQVDIDVLQNAEKGHVEVINRLESDIIALQSSDADREVKFDNLECDVTTLKENSERNTRSLDQQNSRLASRTPSNSAKFGHTRPTTKGKSSSPTTVKRMNGAQRGRKKKVPFIDSDDDEEYHEAPESMDED